jgi:hypothetical protein
MWKQTLTLAAPAVLSIWMSASPLQANGPDEISFNLGQSQVCSMPGG